jgi:hypothetical protein
VKWRAYYDDETICAGDPFEARPHGVICVAVSGKVWHSRDAYYWHRDMGWTPCDVPGMWDYWLTYIGPKAVLFGRNVRDELYWKIVERAMREGVG